MIHNTSNGANLGFEKKLWQAADKMRDNMNAAEKIDISRAMLYRNIDELRDLGYVSTEEGLMLTDAGKIARL